MSRIEDASPFARKTIHHYYMVEGGTCVVDDPDDLGGLTGPGGITKTVLDENKAMWPKHGYTEDMWPNVPYSLSEEIYYVKFWCRMWLDRYERYEDFCDTMFGWGINSGTGAPVKLAQQHINCMNKGGTLYPNMKDDGGWGITTDTRFEDYLQAYKGKQGLQKLIEVLLSGQTMHYLNSTVKREGEKNERFYDGWLNRVNSKRYRLAQNSDDSYTMS